MLKHKLKYIFGISVALVVLSLFACGQSDEEFDARVEALVEARVNERLISATVEARVTIDDFDCEDLGKMAMDTIKDTGSGWDVRIIEIYSTTEKIRLPKELVCEAEVLIRGLSEIRNDIIMTYRQDEWDDEMWFDWKYDYDKQRELNQKSEEAKPEVVIPARAPRSSGRK